MDKQELLGQVIETILRKKKESPLLVGISGVDGAGKTWFAKTLAEMLKKATPRQVIEASIDGFHNPKSTRYQRGENSAEGFYQDSFNYQAVRDVLLDPLHAGNLKFKRAVFDWEVDSEVDSPLEEASSNAILIMEGIFLFRPELVHYWDLKIYIDVDFKITMQRGVQRSLESGSTYSRKELEGKYHSRYIPGQKMYFDEAKPKELADIVIDNNDYENPVIVRSFSG